jgi:AraC-like DNA-binding protein
MDMKLTGAKQILRGDQEYTTARACRKLGFYDQFHFSKRFKEKFGISPSEYRKLHQNRTPK